MEKLKPLVIGDLTAKVPIIQGGMGVGISLHSLAGAVAKAGGIGLISTAQIGFREPDFRQEAPGGQSESHRQGAQKGQGDCPGRDFGIQHYGGYPRLRPLCEGGGEGGGGHYRVRRRTSRGSARSDRSFKTKIAPIVSTAKSANVICKLWDRKYKRVPDLVVIEGPLAGGHLGFSREDLHRLGVDTEDVPATYHREKYEGEVRRILDVVKSFGDKYGVKIPVAPGRRDL